MRSRFRYCRIAAAAIVAAAVLFAGMFSSPVEAQKPASELPAPPDYALPLGIGLEEVIYPYPVGFFPVILNGKEQRMAFMDVPPNSVNGGPAKGRTVVLLHGKNFWGAYWQETINALAQAGYRVIVPDQIGFGKSSKPDDITYSFDQMAENTRDLLDYLKVSKAAVVGHSMGGMLAVRFAHTYPERVTHLILEDPLGLVDYREKVPPRSTDDLLKDELSQSVDTIRKYRQAYFVRWLSAYERFVEVPARVRLSGEFGRWARVSALTSQMIYQQPVRNELHLLHARTLIVIGQEDRTAIGRERVSREVGAALGNYPSLAAQAVKEIPGAILVSIPNCGHIPHIEAEEAFHNALLMFLTAK